MTSLSPVTRWWGTVVPDLSLPATRVNPPVPVGEGHHDVEGCEEQHEVEEGVAVLDRLSLVVLHTLGATTLHLSILGDPCGALFHHGGVIGGQDQLVHLAIVGRPDTGNIKYMKKEVCVTEIHATQQHHIM